MMSEKIKLVMVKRNMNGKQLAEKMGCTPSNVYNLLKKDDWSEKQLAQVAEILDCRFDANFVLNDSGEKF